MEKERTIVTYLTKNEEGRIVTQKQLPEKDVLGGFVMKIRYGEYVNGSFRGFIMRADGENALVTNSLDEERDTDEVPLHLEATRKALSELMSGGSLTEVDAATLSHELVDEAIMREVYKKKSRKKLFGRF